MIGLRKPKRDGRKRCAQCNAQILRDRHLCPKCLKKKGLR